MGMFEMSEQQIADYREQVRGYAREAVADEPVVGAAILRRGGAAAKMGISHAGLGGIAYAGAALFSKKRAGGLPDKALLVATPTKLRAFKAKIKGRDEVAVWDRAGIQASTKQSLGLTMLTVESPSEGEKVTIAPVGIKDDPVSLEFMQVLVDGVTDPPATP